MTLAWGRICPIAWGRRLGEGLGRLALRWRPRERKRAMANLKAALPDLSCAERTALLEKSAAMLGRNYFDMLAAGRLAADDQVFRTAVGPGETDGALGPQMDRLLAPRRGLIILTGHIGCWELLGARLAVVLAGMGRGPLGVVTGEVHNPPVDKLLQDRRRAQGLKVMPRSGGVRPLVEHLRKGGVVAMLLDQKLSDQDPVSDFFGRPAPTPDGLARIALRLGTPVLPVAIAWDESARRHVIHRGSVLNREPPAVDETLAGEQRARRLQQDCQHALEDLVRRNPEQWVWFHDRWLNDHQGVEDDI